MTKAVSTATLETLLSHGAWLRKLAVHLVRDHDAADDLMQETWLAALRRPPHDGGSQRGWLGIVLTNFARKSRRNAGHRAAATFDVEAATGPELSPEAVVTRAELAKMVSELVLELREPYRSTLLLHFFENRSAPEIAEAHGIKAGTVRFRVMYGLDLLRQELDRRNHGDRARWRAALAPLVGSDPRRFEPAAGASAWKWALPLAAVVALGGVALVKGGGFKRSPTATMPVPVEPSDARGRSLVTPDRAVSLPPPSPALARSSVTAASSGPDERHSIFSYDFEDEVLPELMELGQLVSAPPGSPSRFCVMGTILATSPTGYSVSVGHGGTSLFSYAPDAVLSFDYWIPDDYALLIPDGRPEKDRPGSALNISLRNIDQGQNFAFFLRYYRPAAWGHIDLPLSSLSQTGPDAARRQVAGDRVAWISISGGWAGGKPLYIDNLRLTR